MVVTATKVPRVEYRRELGDLYDAREQPALVEVPTISYLMVDARRPERVADVQAGVEACTPWPTRSSSACASLSTASTSRSCRWKGSGGSPTPGSGTSTTSPTGTGPSWWLSPDRHPELVSEAIAAVRGKKKLRALDDIRFEPFDERCAQVLHRGPFAAERPTLERLHDFVKREGFMPVGKHHEVYLTDPQRTAPARMRTIVRQQSCREPEMGGSRAQRGVEGKEPVARLPATRDRLDRWRW